MFTITAIVLAVLFFVCFLSTQIKLEKEAKQNAKDQSQVKSTNESIYQAAIKTSQKVNHPTPSVTLGGPQQSMHPTTHQPVEKNIETVLTVVEPKHINDIHKILVERNAAYLVHITRAENLPSIFRHGIVPRSKHESIGILCNYNDPERLDGHLNASCFSLMHPNYKLFYEFRNRFPQTDYVVLYVDSKAAADYKSYFYPTNAAYCERIGVAPEKLNSAKSLSALFEDYDEVVCRSKLEIKDYFPTDPQAEVLVFDTVPTKYIKGVFFQNDFIRDCYEKHVPSSVDVYVSKQAFAPRHDWEYWRGRRVTPKLAYRNPLECFETFVAPPAPQPTLPRRDNCFYGRYHGCNKSCPCQEHIDIHSRIGIDKISALNSGRKISDDVMIVYGD